VLLVVALAIAGCGSTVTKQDVIRRADAICANTLREVRAAASTAGNHVSPAYADRLSALIADETAQLEKIPRPAKDRALLNEYMAAVGRVAAGYRALAAATKRGGSGAVAAALATLRANPAPALATRYGMTVCSGASGTTVAP
jgi:hypothetical protein